METGELKNLKIACIGAGNMAEALLNGIVGAGIIDPANVRVSDLDSERLELFEEIFAVRRCGSNCAAAEGADLCILAVKPQVLPEVVADTLPGLAEDALVVSIAAGISTENIEAILPAGRRVVRVMPNTPALIGMGISALAAGSKATARDMDLTEIIIGTTGQTVRVDESMMDAVTAMSGSGPAYLFYFMEHMIAAGVELGLDVDLSRKLACETVEGAVRLMVESGLTPQELRARVTSKGGTTAAAIEVMEAGDVGGIIQSAIKAAHARSVELSES